MATTTKLTKDEITATAELLGGNVAEMPQDRLYHLIKATQHATDLLLNEIKHRGELKSQAMCRLPPRIRLRLYPIKVTQHTTDLLLNEIERLRPNDPAGARVRRMIGTTARPKPRDLVDPTWSLEFRCACDRSTCIPHKQLTRRYGQRAWIPHLLARLWCQQCNRRPILA